MKYPRLAFVDAPQLSADVRFDFNADGYVDEFSAGDVAFASDSVDAIDPELAPRQVDFDAIFSGTRRRNHQMVSQLMRELMRTRNWLLWQMNADVQPMWFHTYASGFGSLDFQQVTRDGSDDFYALPLTIDADAGVWGARRDLGPFTVVQDPAVSNGPTLLTETILGDLPPAVMMWASTDDYRDFVVATGPGDAPLFVQAEANAGIGADFALQTHSASYSGAGSNYLKAATFTNNSDVWFNRPTRVGQYRVLAAVTLSNSSTTISASINTDTGAVTHSAGGVTEAKTTAQLLDCGTIQAPMNVRALGYRDDVLGSAASQFFITFDRTAGTGTMNLDYILFVPIDQSYLYLSRVDIDSTGFLTVIDGMAEDGAGRIAAIPAGTTPWTTTSFFDNDTDGLFLHTAQGAFPILKAGVQNRVWFISYTNGDITDSRSVYLSYHPVYLNLPAL